MRKTISLTSNNIKVSGHIGTWYVYASRVYHGRRLFLVEHETYGDHAANLILDKTGICVMEDVWNGWEDYEVYIES